MNAVTLTSAFPKTVQPGIPRLSETPSGWTRAPIGKYLNEIRRPIKMGDDDEYRLVTVKRARGGVVERSRLRGKEVSVKSQFLLEEGDFLISKRQIVHGACGLVTPDLAGSIVSNEYSVLTGTDEIDLKFLNYLAHSVFFQQTCFHSSIGVHIEKMIFKLDRWFRWEFNLPPLPEQRKIADILSTWDRAIEVSEALLATATAQKRSLMQSLLTGHRRFPEFEGQAWKEVRLGDVATVDHNSLGAKTPADYEFNYISLSNVIPGRIVQPLAHIAFKDAPSRARRIVKSGDLLVSTVRPNLLGFARVTNEYQECIASTGFAVVSPDAQVDGAYLFHYLFSHHLKSQFHALVVGSNYPAINSSDVRKLKIILPPVAEQQKIGQVLDNCEKEIAILADQIHHLRTEKKALMQQLLTGKRRVVV